MCARLAADAAFASPGIDGSEDFDFLDFSFFGVMPPSVGECDAAARRPGIFHGPSTGLAPLPPFDNSTPLRALVIANMSRVLRVVGDIYPGIGGWPGASMNSGLPICDG